MSSRRFSLSVALVAAVTVPALLSQAAVAATRSPAAACAAEAGSSTATTASYRFVLSIGMPEKMYTPAQVKKLHPTTGELMVGGAMSAGMGGMAMGTNNALRHLEVTVCSLKTGEVITDAKPTITMSDSMGMATRVPVATMRGVKAAMDDVHYGNNVKMPLGQKLTVKITLAGETAVLAVKVPMHG